MPCFAQLTEMQKLEGCELMIWQFPLWWFAGGLEGMGRPGLCHGAHLWGRNDLAVFKQTRKF